MKITFIVLLMLILHSTLFAQTTQYEIHGSLVDSLTGKPVEWATVSLQKPPAQPYKVTYTEATGRFHFAEVTAGEYVLVFSSVGYKTIKRPVRLAENASLILDSLLFTPDVIGLKEAKVTAFKPVVTQEADRLIYDLQADPESKVFSALDMMRKVPLLALDAEQNISLRGNGDFRIFINGKPSSMMERSYKDVLRSMPASSIQKIEVITSPPAKYDAEGLAGIINIVTTKALENGYNGSVNLSHRFPTGGPGLGGSVSGKNGKLGWSVLGGMSQYMNPLTNRDINRSTTGESPTFIMQAERARTESRNAYLGVEMSYDLDSLNLISVQGNLNGGKTTGYSNRTSDLSGAMPQYYRLVGNADNGGNGGDVSVNYQKTFRADKNRMLTGSYRWFAYSNDDRSDFVFSEQTGQARPDYRQVNQFSFSEQTAQLDYVHPWKKLTIEAGVKAILRKNASDFVLANAIDGGPEAGGQENRFRNTQNVFGVYNSYQYQWKKWNFKAGVRVERTEIDADFMSTNTTLKRNYFNVIPSASVSTKLSQTSSLQTAYNQRINRPGIYQLNPFVDRTNPDFERTGNPDLRPSFINDLQLGYSYSKKISFNVMLGYSFFRDLIFPVAVYDTTSGITRTSYGNSGNAKLPNIALSTGLPMGKQLMVNANARFAYGIVSGIVNDVLIRNEGLMYNVSLSVSYKLPHQFRLNGSVYGTGPSVSLQGTTNAFVSSSLSLSKELFDGKLALSAAVNNPFNKYRNNYRYTFGPDFEQHAYNRDYFRSFQFSANYKFGKLKEAVRKSRRGIRNDDVQSGN